jgi:branched-chain amino acid transport system substrate-binding protein
MGDALPFRRGQRRQQRFEGDFMHPPRPSLAPWLFALAVFSISGLAQAESGITADTILIGRTTAVTGPVTGSIKENTEAINAYLGWVNRQGGINGRKIVLKTLDDGFDPKRAGDNARKLIDEDHVFALFMPRGTPHTEAVLKVAEPAGVPVIAPSTGAEIFHNPVRPLVFNVRAKYQDEVIAAIHHFSTLTIQRIAFIGPTDTFGQDALAGFERGMAQEQLRPALVARFDRAKGDSAATVPRMIAADPQVVIVAASGQAAVTFIHEMRVQGSSAQFLTLSNNSSSGFVKELGADAPGLVMTQVSPAADARTLLGREFGRIALPAGATPSYAAMEAFASVKVLVEGLRRAGRDLTRKTFVAALNSMRKVDLGDMYVDYSPTHHTGSNYVELTIVDAHGKFIR